MLLLNIEVFKEQTSLWWKYFDYLRKIFTETIKIKFFLDTKTSISIEIFIKIYKKFYKKKLSAF